MVLLKTKKVHCVSILKRDWPGGLSTFVELYESNSKDDNLDDNEYLDLESETLILMSELRISLEKLAKRKSTGPDEINAELQK